MKDRLQEIQNKREKKIINLEKCRLERWPDEYMLRISQWIIGEKNMIDEINSDLKSLKEEQEAEWQLETQKNWKSPRKQEAEKKVVGNEYDRWYEKWYNECRIDLLD
jgi:hypothetical protein